MSEQVPGGIADLLKVVTETVRMTGEQHEKSETRAGPLVVVGRLYVSLTLVLAAFTSAASIIDSRPGAAAPSRVIECLRGGVLAVVGLGLLLGVALLIWLLWGHRLLLFSPTELSPEAQQLLLGPRVKPGTPEPDKVTPSGVAPPSGTASTPPGPHDKK